MGANSATLVDVDRLIHEPSRSVILSVLMAVKRADFLYLQRETGLTKGNLTVHLSKLAEAGYIEIEKSFRGKTPLTMCTITKKGKEAFVAYCEQLSRFVDAAKNR